MHNAQNHITLGQNIRNIQMIGMSTSVDNTIHIQVQVIKFRQECFIGNDLIDFGVALTEPSVELRFGGKWCEKKG